jgi:hypothetical protein
MDTSFSVGQRRLNFVDDLRNVFIDMQTRIDCFGKKQNELHFNDNDNNNTRF